MTCERCGTQNEATRKFCRECGARLAVICPTCGAANAPDDRFCGECGTPLEASRGGDAQGGGAEAPKPDASPVAERRLVSVLFADLVGFTPLAESRDPEAVRELQERYFEAARQVIGRYGGSVEKFIGDAVMAVWGAPTAHEDDADRAVRAALDITDAVRQLGEELGADLAARVGVLSGEAAVSIGATNQGMVSGDLVNAAARLQAVAPPGSVLVGEQTYRAASGAIAFGPAGEQALKGKASPMAAYRALRVVGRRGGAGRSEQLEAPFIGRQAELRMLKEFHLATAAERRPRLVSIMGQAGIGKTRLVWEFQKFLDGVADLTYWHQGRSPAYGEGITFWALAEMVRARAGIAESEDSASMRAKLAASIETFVTDATERSWIEPRLLQLLGLEGERREPESSEELFAAWRTFLERIAEQATVVLVFEDLQWADGGLLDFIDHVLDWSRDRPIYVITLARPELLDRRPNWGAGRRNFTSLVLEPLSTDEVGQLLAGLVPGLPESATARIVERAEGVPLYAIETVRMLLSDGRLERAGDAYRPVGDLSELSTPPSLHALVAARLDALDPADRTLLQAASVIGKTFKADALAAVSGWTAEDVANRLRLLSKRELLVADADPRSPERGQHGFVQAVVREVAYGTLARRDRRRLHLSAARYFETLDDEGIAGVLAEHYLAAYRAQPEGPEGEAVAAQGRVALRGAAERASSLGSYRQAAAYLEQALEVTSEPMERADLHAAAAQAHDRGGMTELALPHAERALDLVRPAGDRRRILQALVGVAYELDGLGRFDDGLAVMDEASREYADLKDSAEYVSLAAEAARAFALTGEAQRALELVDATLGTAERLELDREVLGMLITRGPALANLGRIREAIITLQGAVSLATALGIPDLQIRARVNLSYAASADDMALAYRTSRDGFEMAQHLGIPGHGLWSFGNAAEGAIRAGDWDWALEQAEELIAAEAVMMMTSRGRNNIPRAVRARVRGLRGRPVDPELDIIGEALEGSNDPDPIAAYEDIRSDVLLARGEFEEARRMALSSARVPSPDDPAMLRAGRLALWLGDTAGAIEAVTRMRAQPGRVRVAARVEIEAGIAALAGRDAEARATFADAIRRWRELGAQYDVALAQLNMVTMLGASSAESRGAADEARSIFTALGAEPYLRLLDAALTAKRPAAAARQVEPATEEAPTAR